ncbi:hypothetical protein ACLOJK_010097 [Asimina triloba]
MKKGVLIINVARGGVIDVDALSRALNNGSVAQAALDVFSDEPPPKDSKLIQHVNVSVTPHLGVSSAEAQEGVAIVFVEAIVGALIGELFAIAVKAPMVPAEVYGLIPAISIDMTAVILFGIGGDFSISFKVNNLQQEEAPHGAPKQNYLFISEHFQSDRRDAVPSTNQILPRLLVVGFPNSCRNSMNSIMVRCEIVSPLGIRWISLCTHPASIATVSQPTGRDECSIVISDQIKEASPGQCDVAVEDLSMKVAESAVKKFQPMLLEVRPALRTVASMSREDWVM